jgi:uncharacterized protein with HEPN domain
MPPTVEDRLQDVLEAIQEIEVMLAGMSFEQFSADNIRRMAAERYLEIVCEAARHLPNDVKQRSSEIDWRKMNDFANLLRHAYHNTKIEIVWDIIRNHLPPLKAFAEVEITPRSK